ncbi:MAG: RadC family protein [Zhaonellaceae bacterium]|jgi:DNA repair protein RadC
MSYHITIKEMPEELRPRERLQKTGPGSLSDAELLAIILGSGSRKESALALATRILREGEGLAFLANATLEELLKLKGIGMAKATQIKAAVELGKRLMAYRREEKISISTPQDAALILMEDMKFLDREYFKVMLLNTKNHCTSIETISIGTLNASLVHPREVFKLAVKKSAASLILAHNHPSGDSKPSKEDIEITKRLVEAGKIMGIEVLDHIILGNGSFTSLKEQGFM